MSLKIRQFVSFHERLLHGTSWASIFGAILLVHVYEMISKIDLISSCLPIGLSEF